MQLYFLFCLNFYYVINCKQLVERLWNIESKILQNAGDFQ